MTHGNLIDNMQRYIESGEYFIDSKKWYNTKYIKVISQRSILICTTFTLFFALTISLVSMNLMLPLRKQLRYSISVDSIFQQSAQVIKADQLSSPTRSVAQILLKDYIKVREEYSYHNLTKQEKYIKNTSTPAVFKKFSEYLNKDNSNSPVSRYQEDAAKYVDVGDVRFLDDNCVQIKFTSKIVDSIGKTLETSSWESTISFEMDDISLHQKSESPFSFIVTDYKSHILSDKNVKQ